MKFHSLISFGNAILTAPSQLQSIERRHSSVVYTKWDSFNPRKYKINLVRTLAYHCIRICSSPRLLQLALDNLKRILSLNGKYHMNDVIIEKHQNKPKDPVQTVKKKEVLIVLPFLGYHSKHLTKQLRSCINKFYGISIFIFNFYFINFYSIFILIFIFNF